MPNFNPTASLQKQDVVGHCPKCQHIAAAVHEALEEARSIIEDHIEELQLFRFERSAYVLAIVRELETIRAKLKMLEGETRDA